MKKKERKYVIKKMFKYIKRDKFKRLKLLILEKDIHPDSIIGHHNRTALHESAKRGSTDCLRALLECDADPNIKDNKGNYPLHLALKHLLKQKVMNSAIANDLTCPLKKIMNERIHDINHSGTSCWQLLQGLNLKQELTANHESLISSSSSSGSSAESDSKSMDWNEKLVQVHAEDHFFDLGKYNNQQYYNKYKETFDQWADRIYDEFNRRYKTPPSSKKKVEKLEKKPSAFKPDILPPFNPIYPSTRPVINDKYNNLFSKQGKITKTDMPFSKESSAEQIMSAILNGENITDKRKVVREAIRKWHPDKFSQIFAERIVKTDTNIVMDIVTHVSQTLLVYGK